MAKGVFVYWSNMKLKNVLIVVENIEEAKKFYHDLFGLETVLDNEENMILTERLVLQEKKSGRSFLEKALSRRVIPASCILRKKTSKNLWKSWKDSTPPFNMSTDL